jgi:2-oxo-4-hydroxy-4-carboxy--5-ureidoimidazoline (OHCU) decarboxylase
VANYWKLPIEEKFQLLKNIYEDSPWVVKRGLESVTEFSTVEALFAHFQNVFASATSEEKLGVLRAHPDLVGKAALQGMD